MIESVVDGAQLLPSVRRTLDSGRDVGEVLDEEHLKASYEMPVDVAVQDPRSRVVGDESNSDSVSRVASADDVTDGRVLEVVVAGTSAPDDVEGVTVEMDWVWAMVDASVEGKLYNLVACQRHNESLWNIAQNVSVPVENLEQDREIRRLEGLSVDVERVTGRGGV